MGQREHDRHIGSRHRGQPLAIAVDIVAQRTERHDAAAAVAEPGQCAAGRMGRGATVVDTGVLQSGAAEAHQQIGVLGDHRPVRGALEQVVVRAHHPGHDHPGGAEAVGVPRKRVAAKQFEESVHLTLGVVEPTRAGPAVGAAVDRLVAMGVDDTAQLAGEQFGEVVPGHRDELVGAAPVARARPVFEPATSDGRAAHPRLVTYRAGQVAQQRRGIGVARWGGDLDDVAGFDAGVESAPVGEARRDSSSVGDLSHGPSLRRQPAAPDYQPTRRLVYLGRTRLHATASCSWR